ncbi:biotin--[acetyl-CoA-carboxylase] ligase [Macrococcus hajekii]|uniref:Bifunctional ligase/repressor BirA n=1 Tax=Macrococcus hajekii TaxID=198482 RepID=A0A4R6BMG0_9STAP|nr:biotin--[acetyl-CoA-carboxylase] ligase [Macrococcus hajekii]TDM03000.1 biotin--[acetyl-CoA-carboxylase] ligase [Macrococcus hajekii]
MSKYRSQIVELLHHNQHQYLSGQKIAEQLMISRTAVWKTIEQMKQQGFIIDSIQNKGHKLKSYPAEWDADIIQLVTRQSAYFKQQYVFKEVTSTQAVAKEKVLDNDRPFIVISEVQTAGKGRFNRQWDSQGDKGLWMSLVFSDEIPLYKITTFNLFISLAVARTIRSVSGAKAEVKWPNDIYINDYKCCGFLTEISGHANAIQQIICGIGINLNHQQADFPAELQHKATSIKEMTGETVDRYAFLDSLLSEIEHAYQQFLTHDFSDIKAEYKMYSNIWNRSLQYTEGTRKVTGQAVDILDDGRLVVRDEAGSIHHFISADIEI